MFIEARSHCSNRPHFLQAAELVGSLIGMENAINRELAYDASKLVAFPPLWVSPGAKIVRQHEAELNWKDR